MAVKWNQFGYYERIEDDFDIEEMYENQFYQEETGKQTSYFKSYSEQEKRYFKRNGAKKEMILKKIMSLEKKRSMLDLGCGEGFVMDYFFENGWDVTGIDLSDYGLTMHNPHLKQFIKKGNCMALVEEMINQNIEFDFINSDLFMECLSNSSMLHVLLNNLKELFSPEGVLFIRVGNYFSPLHKELMKRGILEQDTWCDRMGNTAYFGKDTLKHFLEEIGYECLEWYGDSFLDFNLINPAANYYKVEGAGKACYQAMLDIEDLIAEESLEKMVEMEKIMGSMGFGRHITCVCKVKGN